MNMENEFCRPIICLARSSFVFRVAYAGVFGCLFICCSAPEIVRREVQQDASVQSAMQRMAPFIGRWEVDGMVRQAGRTAPLKLRGTNEVRWEGDGMFLVARGRANVEGLPVNWGWAAWVYEPKLVAYRGVVIDSSGSVGTAQARWNDATGVWEGQIRSEGSQGTLRLEGQVRFINADTKEERWIGYDEQNQPVMELEKIERREKQSPLRL